MLTLSEWGLSIYYELRFFIGSGAFAVKMALQISWSHQRQPGKCSFLCSSAVAPSLLNLLFSTVSNPSVFCPFVDGTKLHIRPFPPLGFRWPSYSFNKTQEEPRSKSAVCIHIGLMSRWEPMLTVFSDILKEFQQHCFHAESLAQNAGIWGNFVYKTNSKFEW